MAKKVLKEIAKQLEALSITVAALEEAVRSEKYAGRRLTTEQITALKAKAQEDQKEVFDSLHALIGKQ